MSEITLAAPGGAGALSATFVPELNMVCRSLRHEGEELLAERAGLDAYAERGSTFGIPLLYPWANRLAAWDYKLEGRHVDLRGSDLVRPDPDTKLPIHGIKPSALSWRVVEQSAAAVEAVLDFEDPKLLSAFPFPHRAHCRASIAGTTLSISLTVKPVADHTEVPISFGFHPYFELPGCERAEVVLHAPVRRRALLDDHGIPTGAHDELEPGRLDGPIAERTFDDSFDELDEEPTFSVTGGGRRVELEYVDRFPIAQLYVPPDKPFLAIEPMTAPVNALRSGERLRRSEPGRPFRAEFAIRVERVRRYGLS